MPAPQPAPPLQQRTSRRRNADDNAIEETKLGVQLRAGKLAQNQKRSRKQLQDERKMEVPSLSTEDKNASPSKLKKNVSIENLNLIVNMLQVQDRKSKRGGCPVININSKANLLKVVVSLSTINQKRIY